MTSPVLWYLNRGTGVVLLLVFTMTVLLGVLATGRAVHPWWPRFVTQGLHRALAAMSVLLLTAHVLTAVLDEYVDIRWWQAVLPFGATYEPLWLALGAVALDVTVVVVATSLARTRISHRGWSLVHLTTYLAWCSAVAHGIGIGTDAGRPWMASMTAASVAAVVLAALARVTAVVRVRRRRAVHEGGVDALQSALSGGAR